MNEAEQTKKQMLRQRRERKLRLWLNTMSWSTPVFAFGGFFFIWNHISSTLPGGAHGSAPATRAGVSQSEKPLFQVGSTGPQVSTIQNQLEILGYFHHVVTEYYGPITAQAVKDFQQATNLPVTGNIDNVTLAALQQAVKNQRTATLVQSNSSGGTQDGSRTDTQSGITESTPSSSYSQGGAGSSSSVGQGGGTLSQSTQESIPSSVSSAS